MKARPMFKDFIESGKDPALYDRALEQWADEVEQRIDDIKSHLSQEIALTNKLTQENKALKERIKDLEEYVHHKRYCDQGVFGYHQSPCNCGLKQLLNKD